MKLLELILISLTLFNAVNASKILFLLPISTKSHKNVFDPLIEALASRGHDITVISSVVSIKNPKVKEIVPVPTEIVTVGMADGFALRDKGKLAFLRSFNVSHMEFICHKMYQNQDVQTLIKQEAFDLVVMNGVANQCARGLVYHFQALSILITTLPASTGIAEKVGNHFPSSFVPSPFFPYTDRMTFSERVMNLFINVLSDFYFTPVFDDRMTRLYRQYLGQEIPSVAEIDKNLSMIFMNTHMSMTFPRPLLPAIVEVGGMHCRSANPVPKEIDEFLNGAEHGFILFSLGSIVRANNMPESTRKVFINVFSRLKQRVIWKWETETMPDLPSNVKISKWLPQQDILGHKNIRLFITHGGLLSTQEAVYHGVPLIGIPIFIDQDLNMKQAQNIGYCLSLEIANITEKTLEAAVHRVLDEPLFTQRAKDLSAVFRDQQQTSLDRAVFWTEYVLRHKGAPHLQSSAKDLNVIQYYSIDVICFILLLIIVTLWIIKLLIWNVLFKRIICPSKTCSLPKSVKSKKSKKHTKTKATKWD